MRRAAVVVRALALLAAQTCAAQSIADQLAWIETLRARIADGNASGEDRTRAMAELESALERLTMAAAGDIHRPVWMVDLAEAMLNRSAVIRRTFVPEPEAEFARAERAIALLDRADREANETVNAIEASLEASEAEIEVLERLRSVEIPARIPFHRGRAHLILASLAGASHAGEEAERAIESLSGIDLPAGHGRTLRDVFLAFALLERDRPGDAARAAELLRQAVEHDPPFDATMTTHARVASAIATHRLRNDRAALIEAVNDMVRRPPIEAEGKVDPGLRLLAIDALVAELARRQPPSSVIGTACDQYNELLVRVDPVAAASLRPWILERVARLVGSGAVDHPPLAVFARAYQLSRSEAMRGEAADLYEQIAAGKSALAMDALWEAIVLRLGGGDADERRQGVTNAIEFVRRAHAVASLRDQAREALAAALPAARTLAESGTPSDRERYLEALRLVSHATGLPHEDYWRYELARLMLDGADTRVEAIAMLSQLMESAEVGEHAGLLLRAAVRADAAVAFESIRAASRAGDPAATHKAATDALPVLRRAVEHLGDDASRADLADALVEAGHPDARRLYAALLESGAAVPGGEARLRIGIARAARATGDDAFAFATLKSLAASLDSPPSAPDDPPRPEAFWHAWTIMLEILADRDDRAGMSAIRAHVVRLRSIDPEFGGEPWASRIESVERRLPE